MEEQKVTSSSRMIRKRAEQHKTSYIFFFLLDRKRKPLNSRIQNLLQTSVIVVLLPPRTYDLPTFSLFSHCRANFQLQLSFSLHCVPILVPLPIRQLFSFLSPLLFRPVTSSTTIQTRKSKPPLENNQASRQEVKEAPAESEQAPPPPAAPTTTPPPTQTATPRPPSDSDEGEAQEAKEAEEPPEVEGQVEAEAEAETASEEAPVTPPMAPGGSPQQQEPDIPSFR